MKTSMNPTASSSEKAIEMSVEQWECVGSHLEKEPGRTLDLVQDPMSFEAQRERHDRAKADQDRQQNFSFTLFR